MRLMNQAFDMAVLERFGGKHLYRDGLNVYMLSNKRNVIYILLYMPLNHMLSYGWHTGREGWGGSPSKITAVSAGRNEP